MAGVEAIQTLTNQLSRLPGIGRKTAQRLAYHIVSMPEDEVRELAVAIFNGKKKVHFCPICGNLTDVDPCAVCADPERRRDIVCVVRDARDVNALERMRDYNGLYHVLGGVISPMQGISPSDLKIDLLCERIARGGVKEVILAISTSVEGETTLFYLMNRLRQFPGLKVTSIARGIGFGDELEYVDELTITHALMNRREIE